MIRERLEQWAADHVGNPDDAEAVMLMSEAARLIKDAETALQVSLEQLTEGYREG